MRLGARTWFVLGAVLHAASCGPSMRSGDSGVADSATDPDSPTAGASGELDTTFSGDGRHTTNVRGADRGRAIAVQPDGRILVAGKSNDDFLLVRYLADGTVDASFGMGGVVTTDVGSGSNDEGKSLAVQPDGRIVLGGISTVGANANFSMARYMPNGTLDASFGMGGRVNLRVSAQSDEGKSLMLLSDGRVVMAGQSNNGMNNDIALVRVDASGRLDPSFGMGGIVLTDIAGRNEEGNAVRQQPDGKLLVAGYTTSATDRDFVLVRYESNGALDASFGTRGVVTTPVGTGADLGFALALQPDGRILVAGTSANDGRNRFSVVRYNANGTLDATFDGDGRWTRAVGASNDECTGVAVRADGRIVLTGSAYNGMFRDFAAVRLESDGRADETFGDRGALVIPIGERDDGSYAMTLQPDQRVLLVGESVGATDIDLAVVRLR